MEVEGINLGSRFVDIEKIEVSSTACVIIEDSYVTAKRFYCSLYKKMVYTFIIKQKQFILNS